MNKKPVTSIHAIARELEISPSTVSRALNRHPAISSAMRRRVLMACRQQRFTPRGVVPSVGIVMESGHLSMRQGYHSVMLSLLTGTFARRGMAIELIDVNTLERAEELQIGAVVGVVHEDRIASLCDTPNLPVFTLNHPLLEKNVHSAIVDHVQGAVIATEHLLACGHRRIAFLEHNPSGWGSNERKNGYLKTMAGAGVAVDESCFYYRSRDGELYDILRRIRQNACTAILVLDEPSTLEVPHILSTVMGVKVPEEISLLCIEAYSAHAFLSPPQTVIFQPLDKLVERTADAVLSCMTQGSPKQPLNIRLECHLIFRESVRRLSR